MGKKIGKGLDILFGNESNKSNNRTTTSKQTNKKEGFYIYMNDDLKVRLQMHKVKTKVTLSDIVEAAVTKYLDAEEKKL